MAYQRLDREILKEAAKGNWQVSNIDCARSLRYVDVWCPSRYRKFEHIACLITYEERSVINHVRCTMSHGYFERCGDGPGSGLDSGLTGSISYASSVTGT